MALMSDSVGTWQAAARKILQQAQLRLKKTGLNKAAVSSQTYHQACGDRILMTSCRQEI